MGWLLLLVALVLVGLLLWANIASGMNLKDRIDVALEIVRCTSFKKAEGYEDAAREDPDLVGWVKAGNDCIMLFQSHDGNETREVVDFVSRSFHPGLVIHYKNGVVAKIDSGDVSDERVRGNAVQLLREVRQTVSASKGGDDFGFRQ